MKGFKQTDGSTRWENGSATYPPPRVSDAPGTWPYPPADQSSPVEYADETAQQGQASPMQSGKRALMTAQGGPILTAADLPAYQVTIWDDGSATFAALKGHAPRADDPPRTWTYPPQGKWQDVTRPRPPAVAESVLKVGPPAGAPQAPIATIAVGEPAPGTTPAEAPQVVVEPPIASQVPSEPMPAKGPLADVKAGAEDLAGKAKTFWGGLSPMQRIVGGGGLAVGVLYLLGKSSGPR